LVLGFGFLENSHLDNSSGRLGKCDVCDWWTRTRGRGRDDDVVMLLLLLLLGEADAGDVIINLINVIRTSEQRQC